MTDFINGLPCHGTVKIVQANSCGTQRALPKSTNSVCGDQFSSSPTTLTRISDGELSCKTFSNGMTYYEFAQTNNGVFFRDAQGRDVYAGIDSKEVYVEKVKVANNGNANDWKTLDTVYGNNAVTMNQEIKRVQMEKFIADRNLVQSKDGTWHKTNTKDTGTYTFDLNGKNFVAKFSGGEIDGKKYPAMKFTEGKWSKDETIGAAFKKDPKKNKAATKRDAVKVLKDKVESHQGTLDNLKGTLDELDCRLNGLAHTSKLTGDELAETQAALEALEAEKPKKTKPPKDSDNELRKLAAENRKLAATNERLGLELERLKKQVEALMKPATPVVEMKPAPEVEMRPRPAVEIYRTTESTAEPKPAEPKPAEPMAAEPKAAEPKAAGPKPAEPKPGEPMAAEPKAAEPKPAEPMAAEPKAAEPKPAEPMAAEPKAAGPKPAEPKPAEPMAAEPKAAEPKPAEPKPAEPMAAEPKAAEPKPAEPMAAEPKAAEPKPAEPMAAEPKAAGPKPAAPDAPRENGGRKSDRFFEPDDLGEGFYLEPKPMKK